MLIPENPKGNWELLLQILATANVKIFSEAPGIHNNLSSCHFDSFSFQIQTGSNFFFLLQANISYFTSMQLLGMHYVCEKGSHDESKLKSP